MTSTRSKFSSPKPVARLPSLNDLDTELCQRRLRHFTVGAWHTLESRPFIDGWHIDLIAEHLEAITLGHLLRVIFSMPPGHMKSLLCSVMWLAWEWGPRNRPGIRSLNISYADDLALRDSRKTKRVIRSPWYRERWGDRFKLTLNQEARYANDHNGERIATSTGGVATGERGDRIVFDDPHNVLQVLSDKERARTLLFWDETMTTRVVSPATTARVIVAQRTHHQDLTGHIVAKNSDFLHVELPGEFEATRKYSAPANLRPFLRSAHARDDPRTIEGEPLWQGLYDKAALDQWARDFGGRTTYAWISQVQQRPTPRGGGLFKRIRVNFIAAPPAGAQWVRHWDLAGTKETPGLAPAFTAGVKMGKHADRYIIGNVVRFRGNPSEVETTIKRVAQQDGYACKVSLPQDPGQAGKFQASYLIGKLAGFSAAALIESGDKETRAEPFASQWEGGNVDIVVGAAGLATGVWPDWVEPYLLEMEQFPATLFKDQADASSGCFLQLTGAGTAQTIKLFGH